jgi:hypothetical protein
MLHINYYQSESLMASCSKHGSSGIHVTLEHKANSKILTDDVSKLFSKWRTIETILIKPYHCT